ncbi:AAA family ATPase [Actinacidiphila epipremni]|nr:AAA family ATPase [Actinacidiphila epipremni]
MTKNPEVPEPPAPDDPPTLSRLVRDRLAASTLAAPVKTLLLDVLGAPEPSDDAPSSTPAERVYLESVAVTGFRGIGRRAKLPLAPKPGVTLVVGRNGSGKSSFADGIETALTGTSARWDGRSAVWRDNWRNLHHDGDPRVEAKVRVAGDDRPSTITCAWPSDDVSKPETTFKRPGHGTGSIAAVGWERPLADYRPFLPYSDLDRMISGKPSEMYDTVARILGLGRLTAAADLLKAQEKALAAPGKAAADELPSLVAALDDSGDPRATTALAALTGPGAPDLEALTALVDGLPAADDAHLRRLRTAAALNGPDLARVGTAVDRLREALAVLDDVRATGAEDAHQQAELLAKALDHARRHRDDPTCPVCGSDRPLDDEWAEQAAARIDALRHEASAAEKARQGLRDAEHAVRDLIAPAPEQLPAALADPWARWAACRRITGAEQLAAAAEDAAVVLADACDAVRKEAARELAALDEAWRGCVVRLAGWLGHARDAAAAEPRLREIRAAIKWLRAAAGELRQERLRPFADHSQRIWEELRQQSDVELGDVRLTGSDKASVRKLVMDVTVDGEPASALGVMSQGELHSLALALFLPRAAAAESPFGFVVIDDPVQSMDPAKVHGLAKVLHSLGKIRQVVVFTHDTRLQQAFTDQELPVTVLAVERAARSAVRVEPVTDPIHQALNDARALACTPGLPPAAMTHVLPGICRTVLERAFTEAAWVRLHRAGTPEPEAEQAVRGATGLRAIAALGLFGDASRTDDVYMEVRRRCGGGRAVEVLSKCQAGSHPGGTTMPDPKGFIRAVEAIALVVRTPEEGTQR